MFGFDGELVAIIPKEPPFYSLYADGPLERKAFVPEENTTYLAYRPGAVVALYYTYPAYRAASLVRNVPGGHLFPGLSKTVKTLFSIRASRVDKLKRALAFLNKHYGGAWGFPDEFYARLFYLIEAKGKLPYTALARLSDKYGGKTAFL